MMNMTTWACPFPDIQVFGDMVFISTTMTKLGGWEKLINLDQRLPPFLQLIRKERRKHPPTVVVDRFSKAEGFRHPLHVQIFYRYHVEGIHEFTRSLVKEIPSLVGNLLMAKRHFPSLFPIVLAAKDAVTQLPLFPCEFFFGESVESRISWDLSFGGHVKFVHGKIQTDKCLRVLLFDFLAFEREKNTDKIFTGWRFRDRHRLGRPMVGDCTMLNDGDESDFRELDFLSFDTDRTFLVIGCIGFLRSVLRFEGWESKMCRIFLVIFKRLVQIQLRVGQCQTVNFA